MTNFEWHDLKKDPADLPEEGLSVMITAQHISGAFQHRFVTKAFYFNQHWHDLIDVDPLEWNYYIYAWTFYPSPYDPASETPPKVEEAKSDP